MIGRSVGYHDKSVGQSLWVSWGIMIGQLVNHDQSGITRHHWSNHSVSRGQVLSVTLLVITISQLVNHCWSVEKLCLLNDNQPEGQKVSLGQSQCTTWLITISVTG